MDDDGVIQWNDVATRRDYENLSLLYRMIEDHLNGMPQ